MATEATTQREPTLDWVKGTDPVSQASLWVPERMYSWQVNVLRDCMVRGSRVSCVTPNESGKTSVVIPVLGLSWMAAFPGSQVVSTAGVERQIKKQLWPVLKGTLRRYPKWHITDDLKIRAPGVKGFPGSEWEAFTTNDPEYAEGFHPRWYRNKAGELVYAPLLIIIDEAKSFNNPEMMFAFLKRCSPDVLLMISTPGEDSGDFYDSFHVTRGRPWKCHEVGWDDCPHLKIGFKLQERLQTIEDLGANNPLVQSWVFGKFYRGGARRVFDNMDDIERAMSGEVRHITGHRTFALDFSGGGDEQVFGARIGNRIMPFETFHEPDAMKLADIFCGLFRRWSAKPEEIVADNGGLGQPCIDILEAKGYVGIRRYMGNEEAKDSDQYQYRITEDHFEVRKRLAQGALSLPNDPRLKEQMRKRNYLLKNDSGKLQIEPKKDLRKRGEPSPDRLDVVVMACADMPPFAFTGAIPRERRAAGICGDPKDCFGDVTPAGTGTWSEGGFFE